MTDSRGVSRIGKIGLWLVIAIALASATFAQTAAVVPTLVNFSGTLSDVGGKPLTGIQGVTFYLYQASEGGPPLWMETQNVQPDKTGHYSVMLGSTASAGLPTDLFASGEARWLGVQAQGQAEQPRVMLLAVPYALKAGDAQTIGGLPPSAFVLAAPAVGTDSPSSASSSNPTAPPAVGGSGTTDFLPIWTSSSNLGNSVLFQSGTGSTAKVGINTTTPASTLDIKGSSTVRGTLQLPSISAATATAGSNSNPFDLAASSFNSGTGKAVNETFQWQSEPAGNNTASPSGTLNLLFGSGTAKPAETGLKVSNKGLFTFATGQTFPGTGTITGVSAGSGLSGGGTTGNVSVSLMTGCANGQVLQWNGTKWVCASAGTGTITGVTAGTDLTGGGTNGNITLNLDTTKVPQLNVGNTFNGNQAVTGNVTASGTVSGGLGSFSTNSGSSVLNVTQNATSGPGFGIVGTSLNNNRGQAAILGQEMATSSQGVYGVYGFIGGANGAGIYGQDSSPQSSVGTAIAGGVGVWGDSGGSGTIGVLGTTTSFNAIVGFNKSSSYTAVVGENQQTGGGGISPGVAGISLNSTGIGTLGAGPVFSQNFDNGAGAQTIGVVGDTATSGGIGVWGSSDNGTSVFGSTGNGTGVYGLAPHGTAVYGLSAGGTGIYGETDAGIGDVAVFGSVANGADIGVLGTAGSQTFDGAAVEGVADSYQDWAGYFEQDDIRSLADLAFGAGGPGTGYCNINVEGDLVCTGSTSQVVPLADKRQVQLYAMASPENWFEDFGSGTLQRGSASIALEPTFRETVSSSEEYHVFLTPKGDCKGLYVTGETANGFEVRELGEGKSSIAFDYRIVVRRKGYETIRLADASGLAERHAAMAERIRKLPRTKTVPITPASQHPGTRIPMPLAPPQVAPLRASSRPVAPIVETTVVSIKH